MKAPRLLLCLILLALPSRASAGLPKPGQIYDGPKSFSSPAAGIAFALPEGSVGGIDGDFFTIVDSIDQGKMGLVLLWSEKGSAAQARAKMGETIKIKKAILSPTSKVTGNKNVLRAHYSIRGSGKLTQATITTRVEHGLIVAVITAYAPAARDTFLPLGAKVESSLELSEPAAPKPSAHAPRNGAP